MDIISQADKVFQKEFGKEIWFGKCIFISWYCELGTCKFCFRSHNTAKNENRRTRESILAEAFISKKMGWRLEFLTGGCNSHDFEDISNLIKDVHKIYGEKLWINLGLFNQEQLEHIRPYVEGICASIETTSKVHDDVCPDKPIKPYENMLQGLKGFKKSACIIIGIGETKEDLESLHAFIQRNKLDRITFYALKPIKGSPFQKSPEPEYYAWWIAQTRIKFPKLEIMAGLTPQKPEYAEWVLRAGANGITKFPAIRKFGSQQAKDVEEGIKRAGRNYDFSLTQLKGIDWEREIKTGLGTLFEAKVMHYVNRLRNHCYKA